MIDLLGYLGHLCKKFNLNVDRYLQDTSFEHLQTLLDDNGNVDILKLIDDIEDRYVIGDVISISSSLGGNNNNESSY